MTVVSEMGEQWSPKIPPDSTTPMAMPTGAPMEMARDTAMGMKMANTLQELPVEKEVRQAAMKMIAHIEVGVRKLSQVLTIQVPQAEQMLPMPQASMRIIRTSIMPVQPSMKVLRAFLKFQTLLIMPMMMAEMEARMKAVSSARRELPLASAPKMPLVLMSPV